MKCFWMGLFATDSNDTTNRQSLCGRCLSVGCLAAPTTIVEYQSTSLSVCVRPFIVFNVFITLDLRFSLSIFCCWCCYCCRSAVGNLSITRLVRILGSSLWKKYVHKTSETCVLSKNKFFFQSMEIFFFILKRTSLY